MSTFLSFHNLNVLHDAYKFCISFKIEKNVYICMRKTFFRISIAVSLWDSKVSNFHLINNQTYNFKVPPCFSINFSNFQLPVRQQTIKRAP